MTDTELVHQVEQALLGAMITRPKAITGLGEIPPELFTDQRHQAIAAALTGTAGTERGLLGRLRGLFARFSRQAREAEQYMETLPGLCPDAAHIGSYHRILAEARALREAAAQAAAERAAQNTQTLDAASRNLAVQTGDTPRPTAPGELASDVARLARTLSTRTRRPTSAPAPAGNAQPAQQQEASGSQAAGSQTRPAPQQARVPAQAASTQATPAPEPGAAPQTASRNGHPAAAIRTTRPEDVQDLILAALMRDPDEARNVCSWLPASVFPEGPRRELFTMISEHVRNRREVDPLIMAWAADLRKSAGPAGDTWNQDEGWASPAFTLGIGRLGTAPGTAIILGRMLLAEHMVTTGTAASTRPVVPGTAQTTKPDTSRAPEVTHEPAPRQAPAPDRRQRPTTAPAHGNGTRSGAGEDQRSVRNEKTAPASGPQLRPPAQAPAQPGIVPGM